MTPERVVAVTGATGFVGCALRDEAARRGVPLRALTRREQRTEDGVEWVRGDLHDREAIAALVAGAEAVVHVAGVVNTPDPMGFPSTLPRWKPIGSGVLTTPATWTTASAPATSAAIASR